MKLIRIKKQKPIVSDCHVEYICSGSHININAIQPATDVLFTKGFPKITPKTSEVAPTKTEMVIAVIPKLNLLGVKLKPKTAARPINRKPEIIAIIFIEVILMIRWSYRTKANSPRIASITAL